MHKEGMFRPTKQPSTFRIPPRSDSRSQGYLLCHCSHSLVEISPIKKVKERSKEGKEGGGREEGEKEAGMEYILTLTVNKFDMILTYLFIEESG